MGISSSAFSFLNNFSNAKTAKLVLDAAGSYHVRQVKLPLKAAELVLEEDPGHVISPADEIRRTGRFVAVKAEEELVARKVYLLVPLCKVNRKVSESDMALIDLACKKKRSRTSSKRTSSKILPATPVEEPGLEGVESQQVDQGKLVTFPGSFQMAPHMKGYNKAWSPVLEPISEI